MRTRRFLTVFVALALAMTIVAPAASAATGDHAYSYVHHLSLGSRVAGTPSEAAAAGMIGQWLDAAGYDTRFQPFTFGSGKKTGFSQNVIGFLPANGAGEGTVPLVIVGAHYDSVVAGDGADDNASGVGAMLEIAEVAAGYQRDYDLVFVAFGAEEVGLEGSAYYVSQMSQADKDRTVAMINFDSLIAGDMCYIHAGFNELTGPRDAMLGIIDDLDLPIAIQPGLNPHYPAGLTPDGFSDYTAFNRAGIPIVAFESTNWEIGDLDGYVQTVKYGSFWHTGKDKLTTIEKRFPGRPARWLSAYVTLVSTYLMDPTP